MMFIPKKLLILVGIYLFFISYIDAKEGLMILLHDLGVR
ncbi:hypothetical protein RCZAHN_103 [Rhodobacter phage RcZahn]|nr:hypothetical protein RCZAHN_103 [Rhodobacter phage RcZahn]